MSAIPFDSHEFYSELVQSGLAEKTADALTKAVVKIEKAKLEELTTKRDLAETKADLTRTILSVGVGVGLAQLLAIFLLFMRMAGKA
jgi:CHASE3 domain sensor protein